MAAAPAKAPIVKAENAKTQNVKAEWAPIDGAGVAAAPAAPARKTASTQAGGAYRLQVAAVRSSQEALGVAQLLQERYGREIGPRAPSIDQTVMGNMGTIYRVKVGPFASAAEPQALCERLKADGMDCLIVTQ